jgi:hypothetical protein
VVKSKRRIPPARKARHGMKRGMNAFQSIPVFGFSPINLSIDTIAKIPETIAARKQTAADIRRIDSGPGVPFSPGASRKKLNILCPPMVL